MDWRLSIMVISRRITNHVLATYLIYCWTTHDSCIWWNDGQSNTKIFWVNVTTVVHIILHKSAGGGLKKLTDISAHYIDICKDICKVAYGGGGGQNE